MKIKKLSAFPYDNAFVEIDENNNSIYLWSCNTLVCKVEDDWLTVNGFYSAITDRHISAFLREYTNCAYSTAKQIYEDGYCLNLYTGEVQRVE